jgi:hypothetical protein
MLIGIVIYWIGFCTCLLFGRISWRIKYTKALELISDTIIEEAKTCQTCQAIYKSNLGSCVSCSTSKNIATRTLNGTIPYIFYSSSSNLISFSLIWPFTLTIISIFELADEAYPIIKQYIENKKAQFIEESVQIQTKKLRAETKLREAELESARVSNKEKATQQLREIQFQVHKK